MSLLAHGNPPGEPASEGPAGPAGTLALAAPRRGQLAVAFERVFELLLFLAAVGSVAITAGIVFILVGESIPFFRNVPIVEFLTGRQWTPLFEPPRYGILPLIAGTLTTTMVALLVAMPVGTILAIWLSEFAPARVRETFLRPPRLLYSRDPIEPDLWRQW